MVESGVMEKVVAGGVADWQHCSYHYRASHWVQHLVLLARSPKRHVNEPSSHVSRHVREGESSSAVLGFVVRVSR